MKHLYKIQSFIQQISHKNLVLLLSVVVGILSGMSAVVIKNSVHFIQWLLTWSFVDDYHNYLYFFYPLVGIVLVILVTKKFLMNKSSGHGIPNTLYAISKKNGVISRLSMFSSIITSTLTVGFGGSVGLEGPVVSTSAAIGSNLGRYFKVDYKTKKLLIGCAACGALSAIFKAPIAAIVFAIEVIMLDLTTASLVPLLLASISAILTSWFFLGEDILFHFKIEDKISFSHFFFYIGLGLVSGFFSIYFSKVYFFTENLFDQYKSRYGKAIIGGLMLGILIFLLPPLYGEGFKTVNLIIEGDVAEVVNNSPFYAIKDNIYLILGFLLLVVFFKAFATSISFGAGGIGGIFAPTLFMGSILGFVYSKLVNLSNITNLSLSNFSLVGMAGLMAGILQAPLTAIFLIAEITGGYELFVPLMITSAISFMTAKYYLPYSVYTMQLAKRGELITHHKDQAILTLMKLQSEIETNFEKIKPEMNLGYLVKVVSKSKRNLFAVVDENTFFLGVVTLDDIREIMFNIDMYESVTVQELMVSAMDTISITDTMDKVMQKFESSGAWNLPVLDDGKYIGFVSKSKLFSAYRSHLKDFYEE